MRDPECEVHHYHMGDGRCTCTHVCKNCGTTYTTFTHPPQACVEVLLRLVDGAWRAGFFAGQAQAANVCQSAARLCDGCVEYDLSSEARLYRARAEEILALPVPEPPGR